MPNGADTLYSIIDEETERAENLEQLGFTSEARRAWFKVLSLWKSVLEHHDSTTGCGQEALTSISRIRKHLGGHS